MREFRSNCDAFIRRTRRRVIVEISILVILTGYFLSDWSSGLPHWLEISALVILVVYIVFGLAYYPRAKSIANEFSVHLMDEALGFPSQGNIKKIPYSDLTISKVTKKNGEVVAIRLQTTFGQSITLQGLDKMNELYDGMIDRGLRTKGDVTI